MILLRFFMSDAVVTIDHPNSKRNIAHLANCTFRIISNFVESDQIVLGLDMYFRKLVPIYSTSVKLSTS
jgi:hypothetical protein